MFVPLVLLAFFLVAMAGMMSGLTLGLMSLDQVDIEVGAGSGRPSGRMQGTQPAGCLLSMLASWQASLHILPREACGLRARHSPVDPHGCRHGKQVHRVSTAPRPLSSRRTRRPGCAQILRRSGTERQRRLAQRIQPVLERPHVLLVSLLVCNALAAEGLPLVLDRLADPATAIILSVSVVLVFGEAGGCDGPARGAGLAASPHAVRVCSCFTGLQRAS